MSEMLWYRVARQLRLHPEEGERAEEMNMLEISRILAAAGASLAGVALTVYGIAHALNGDAGWEATFGIWGMIVGILATIVGLVMHQRLAED